MLPAHYSRSRIIITPEPVRRLLGELLVCTSLPDRNPEI